MIRDQIEDFEVTDEILRKHSNETGAINYLFAGLEFLYEMVKRAEREAPEPFAEIEELAASRVQCVTEVPPGVRICAFHWYATTACNLVKMIGWLHQRQDSSAASPADYLGKVLPEVEPWRNKVSAHFALHTPQRGRDTPADEFASLIPPTAQVNGRFVAGAYHVVVTRSSKASRSQLRPWSLTQVHEQLRARYGFTAHPEGPGGAGTASDRGKQ